jgi:hypothetical protein
VLDGQLAFQDGLVDLGRVDRVRLDADLPQQLQPPG